MNGLSTVQVFLMIIWEDNNTVGVLPTGGIGVLHTTTFQGGVLPTSKYLTV